MYRVTHPCQGIMLWDLRVELKVCSIIPWQDKAKTFSFFLIKNWRKNVTQFVMILVWILHLALHRLVVLLWFAISVFLVRILGSRCRHSLHQHTSCSPSPLLHWFDFGIWHLPVLLLQTKILAVLQCARLHWASRRAVLGSDGVCDNCIVMNPVTIQGNRWSHQ